MTKPQLTLNENNTKKHIYTFLSYCVKSSLQNQTAPYVYGGISHRWAGAVDISKEYFNRRVRQLFRNSDPQVFGFQDLLILNSRQSWVLIKYQTEWCFTFVPEMLRPDLFEFGRDNDILCKFAADNYYAANVANLADYN